MTSSLGSIGSVPASSTAETITPTSTEHNDTIRAQNVSFNSLSNKPALRRSYETHTLTTESTTPSSTTNQFPSLNNSSFNTTPIRSRPSPIRIPDLSDSNLNVSSTPSPRAAIVAGLRSATDRRQQQLQQNQMRQQHTSLSGINNTNSSQAHYRSPQIASPSSFANTNVPSNQSYINSVGTPSYDRFDQNYYASLKAKQQELIATSQIIAQQQRRIQQAMNKAAYGQQSPLDYELLNDDSSYDRPIHNLNHGPEIPDTRPMSVGPPPYSPYYSNTQPFSPLLHSHQSSSSFYNSNNGYSQSLLYNSFNESNGDRFDRGDSPLRNRPSSPSVPVRPSSSASFRGSLLFQPSIELSDQPILNSSSNAPFRRTHRKASSLSSSLTPNDHSYGNTYPKVGVIGSDSPAVKNSGLNPTVGAGTGILTGSKLGAGEYEVPSRQPIGPPPIDELKHRQREKNFVYRYNSNKLVMR